MAEAQPDQSLYPGRQIVEGAYAAHVRQVKTETQRRAGAVGPGCIVEGGLRSDELRRLSRYLRSVHKGSSSHQHQKKVHPLFLYFE